MQSAIDEKGTLLALKALGNIGLRYIHLGAMLSGISKNASMHVAKQKAGVLS